MSRQLVVMIHTVAAIVDGLRTLCHELMPDVEVVDIVDGALLRLVLQAGDLTPPVYRRVCDNVVFAAECQADVVLVTCSSISPCVDAARPLVPVPVLTLDEPMAKKAVQLGNRVGVIATAPTALKPVSGLVRRQADHLGRLVEVESVLCEGAYGRLLRGDMAGHDQIVLAHLRRVMRDCDVVVLAQASMARVVDQLTTVELTVPVLSSPRLGLERTAAVLQNLHYESPS